MTPAQKNIPATKIIFSQFWFPQNKEKLDLNISPNYFFSISISSNWQKNWLKNFNEPFRKIIPYLTANNSILKKLWEYNRIFLFCVWIWNDMTGFYNNFFALRLWVKIYEKQVLTLTECGLSVYGYYLICISSL